jgi:hypothetical protein
MFALLWEFGREVAMDLPCMGHTKWLAEMRVMQMPAEFGINDCLAMK